MRRRLQGFDMVYYLDQVNLNPSQITAYQGEPWAPLNSTHLIAHPVSQPEESYWCFEKKGDAINCLGLFEVSDETQATIAERNEFHDVTSQLKGVFDYFIHV